jgi:uncharacterized DUF497 family protein
VKYYAWSAEKNESLKLDRGVSFEEVVFHIERGDLLDVLEHPNQRRYPGQRIFVVDIRGYAYLVTFVESEREIFLKTAIPNRRATNTYLVQSEKNDQT